MLSPDVYTGGRRRSRGLKTKTLRRMCKSKGLKTTGKKATLMKRLHMRGGVEAMPGAAADDAEGSKQGDSDADKALAADPGFQEPAVDAAVDAAAPAAAGPTEAGRRRRRSRRREEGGRRRHSRRKVTEVALGH